MGRLKRVALSGYVYNVLNRVRSHLRQTQHRVNHQARAGVKKYRTPLIPISRDPIGYEAGDANLYRYVDNSPVDITDPLGLERGSNKFHFRPWVWPWDERASWNPLDTLGLGFDAGVEGVGGCYSMALTGEPSPKQKTFDQLYQAGLRGFGRGDLLGNSNASLGQWLYTDEWEATDSALQTAVTSQGYQDAINCVARCIACENKKVGNWIASMGATTVAYGGTPRPIATFIAGGETGGHYLKSGVRSAGVRLGRMGFDSGYNLLISEANAFAYPFGRDFGTRAMPRAASAMRATAVGAARGARIGVAGMAVLESIIAAKCSRRCSENSCYKCDAGKVPAKT